jgi:hypothetical protein
VCVRAGIPLLLESSIKRALDIDWNDAGAKAEAIRTFSRQLDALQGVDRASTDRGSRQAAAQGNRWRPSSRSARKTWNPIRRAGRRAFATGSPPIASASLRLSSCRRDMPRASSNSRLESTNGPVGVLVIDRLEHPTEELTERCGLAWLQRGGCATSQKRPSTTHYDDTLVAFEKMRTTPWRQPRERST